MATISSHVLDSVVGSHAAGIRVQCYLLSGGSRTLVFDVIASDEGRITESVNSIDVADQYELVFFARDYFSAIPLPPSGDPVVTDVVMRLSVTRDDAKYHVPIMLSAHSYSVWWSAVSV